ncbi:hypothetical protein Cp1R7AA1_062 [Mesorhizobium phage Cp1R7A-A1]|nr:hypothetical protein Cp1R7AA1_062 [Mesorhizobium phage Cp1R7A-A1]
MSLSLKIVEAGTSFFLTLPSENNRVIMSSPFDADNKDAKLEELRVYARGFSEGFVFARQMIQNMYVETAVSQIDDIKQLGKGK